MTDVVKCVGDCLSIGGTIATLIGYLPAVTAILTFVWTLLRIYESVTVQRFIDMISKRVEDFRNSRHGRK